MNIPPYSPRSNGNIERLVGQIGQLLRCSARTPDEKNWHTILPFVMYAHNSIATNELGGFSPNEIQFGRDMPANFVPIIPPSESFEPGKPGEYLKTLARVREYQYKLITEIAKREQEKRRNRHNETAREDHMNIGDFIMAKNKKPKKLGTSKLSTKYEGPYRIIDKTESTLTVIPWFDATRYEEHLETQPTFRKKFQDKGKVFLHILSLLRM